MPKKLTEEQKQAAYEAWQQTDEYGRINLLSVARATVGQFDMSTNDIVNNWSQFLNELFEVGTIMKIPGRKAKCKKLCSRMAVI